MNRKSENNRYCNFKGDRERRRALNTLAWSRTITAIATALAMASIQGGEVIRWLMR
jgi:hypothetical protein